MADATSSSASSAASPTFDEVFCGLLPRLYRRAVMLAGSRQSAEDVVHEAYLRLAARPQRFLAHPEPYAYAFTAVLNVARDAYRKDRRQVLVDGMDGVEDAGAGGGAGPGAAGGGWDGGVERRQAEIEAVRLLGKLSHRQAGIVILVDLDGYTIDQAAKIMKVHRGTAARHRARALDRLRAYLVESEHGQAGR
ncbi:RNA polymerase sigma factor [Streptomyces sp. MCA2]|uniref:RNA polymerase sigma factor n=1 Tax=Streptomyces decoyicus TaxID=249567 RepID=A0ABZ1FJN9_9ACTN|nr:MULTISPECIES: RNA polymerase sigma factor [Streptomyces]MCL7497662.1 RNA polymerase sigma factor [Streptomyces sp. MCA2]WSB70648.1 RNA polymerase sigma factor [Streptomyces decoyicus]